MGDVHVSKRFRTLIIKPKTKSTIIALFQNDVCVFKETLTHHQSSERQLLHILDEAAERTLIILQALNESGINISYIDAVCADGGLLRPIEGGTYKVNDYMLDDLIEQYNGIHASNLGAIIAHKIASQLNINAYIVDPPVVNELSNIAKVTGLPGIERKSIFHALNHKYVARKAALEMEKSYEDVHLIVAHLGFGITIGAHKKGKVIDVNNGLHGDGPFSIERAGTIPAEGLINLAYSGVFTQDDLVKEITYGGGLKAYLHTEDLYEIENRIKEHDSIAQHIYSAMAYQIAKEISAMAAVLTGKVDGIVLTGPLAYSQFLSKVIMEQVNWIADIYVYPGEYDLFALNEGVLRILRKEEKPKEYKGPLEED